MKVSAIITLKKDVLDPQGKVIHQTLDGMVFKYVNEVRVLKKRHELLGEYIVAEVVLNKLKYDKEKMSDNLRKFCLKNMTKYKVPSKFIILHKI